jgi:hypothetical protein
MLTWRTASALGALEPFSGVVRCQGLTPGAGCRNGAYQSENLASHACDLRRCGHHVTHDEHPHLAAP